MEKRSHLCLARVYSRREAILQQNRLRHKAARRRGGSRAQPCQHQPPGPLVIVPTLACRHAFLFNVSLDWSRACPGKPIGFMPHWRREVRCVSAPVFVALQRLVRTLNTAELAPLQGSSSRPNRVSSCCSPGILRQGLPASSCTYII
jgi:hypothetical protein